jgi:hypothetical protein
VPQSILQVRLAQQSLPLTQGQQVTQSLLERLFMASMLELPFTQPTLELLYMPQMPEQPFTLTPLEQPHHQLTQAHTLLMGLML